MKECTFYKRLEKPENAVKCSACRHGCTIAESRFGICGVRKNIGGKLFLITYAKPCSIHLDPMEKKPLFHYKPGTEIMSIGFFGCNFSCAFCQNYDISAVKGEQVEKLLPGMQEVSPEKFISLTEESGAKSVAFTYNESAISIEYCLDAIALARKKNFGTVFVSNGYESEEQIKSLRRKLDAINIDLKSFDDEFYKKICGAKLEGVLETIKSFHKNKTWTEITTLLIPGKNTSHDNLKQLADFISSVDKSIPWHVSAFHPCHKMAGIPKTSANQIKEAMKIGKDAGLRFVYGGNLSDSDLESTYCPNCGAKIIERSLYGVAMGGLEKAGGLSRSARCADCGEKIEGVFE
ncbi:MAG: AmmeMemoRadiSam system radical SAM enzyme [Candidatus Diapherotrites archaeon]|nr:AmmeMemoRadiSam system radical SAM enzyme [Candidatus Diapherotrites archaeon]